MKEDMKEQGQEDTFDPYFNTNFVFEFSIDSGDQLSMGSVNICIYDHDKWSADDFLGSYFSDLSYIWRQKDHEIFRNWVALTDPTGELSGVRGNLKVSVSIVPPGGVLPFHDPAAIAAADAANVEVMMPPVLNVEPYILQIELFRAEDLPAMDAGGSDGSKCDAFGKVSFSGNKKETEIIQSQQPDWCTQGSSGTGHPAMMKLQFTIPAGGGSPMCSDNIEFGIYDKDIGFVTDDDEPVGVVRLSFKKILRRPEKHARPFWVYFYGGPEEAASNQLTGMFSAFSSPDELGKSMNTGRLPGCFYRGRALIAISVFPKQGISKNYEFKPEPPDVTWLLCVELYEASDLPFDKDVSIVISVGSQGVVTKTPERMDGTGGGRVLWYQTSYINLKFPTDIAQVPKIFINLYKGNKRISYYEYAATAVGSYAEMYPTWHSLKKDPFGPLGAEDYAGSLLLSIGLGKEDDLEESRAGRRAKQAQKDKVEYDKQVIMRDERSELTKHIVRLVSKEGRTAAVTLAAMDGMLKQCRPEPGNLCWFENLEMVCEQAITEIITMEKTRGKLDAGGNQLPGKAQAMLEYIDNAVDCPDPSRPGNDTEDKTQDSPDLRKRKTEVQSKLKLAKAAWTGKGTGTKVEMFAFVDEFEKVWDDSGLGAAAYGSLWSPKFESKAKNKYVKLGDSVSTSRNRPESAAVLVLKSPLVSSPPTSFELAWHVEGDVFGSRKGVCLWRMNAPAGYKALGFAATEDNEPPEKEDYACVSESLVVDAEVDAKCGSNYVPFCGWSTSGCKQNYIPPDKQKSLWIIPRNNSFLVLPEKEEPQDSQVYCIDRERLPGRLPVPPHVDHRGALQYKSGTFGFWTKAYFTLNFEALTEYASVDSAVPRRVFVLNSNGSSQGSKVTKIEKLKKLDFELEVDVRDTVGGDSKDEELTFRANTEADAAEWHQALMENLSTYDVKGTAEFKEAREAQNKVSAKDVLASLKEREVYFKTTVKYTPVWKSDGSSAKQDLSIWRPKLDVEADGNTRMIWFGDYAHTTMQQPGFGTYTADVNMQEFVNHDGFGYFKMPDKFTLVANISLKHAGWDGVWFWRPEASPSGGQTYESIGLVITTTKDNPSKAGAGEVTELQKQMEKLRCIRSDLLDELPDTRPLERLWDDVSILGAMLGSTPGVSLWKAPPPLSTFQAGRGRTQPGDDATVFKLRDCLVPDDMSARDCFVKMEQYFQNCLVLDQNGSMPLGITQEQIWAEVEHAINMAPLQVTGVSMIEAVGKTNVFTHANVHMAQTRPLSENALKESWDTAKSEIEMSDLGYDCEIKDPLIYHHTYKLRCHIYQGRNLPAADSNGLSDPYLRISCAGSWAEKDAESQLADTDGVNADRVHRTKIKYKTVNPMWYETLEFKNLTNMPSPPKKGALQPGEVQEIWPNLTVHLIDYDDDGKNDFLGRVVVPLDEVARDMYHQTNPRWRKIFIADADDSQGELLCAFQLIPYEISSSFRIANLKTATLRKHCLAANLLYEEQRLTQAIIYKLPKEKLINALDNHVQQGMYKPQFKDCTVEVVVLGCRELKASSSSLSSSPTAPYAEIDIGDPDITGKTKSSSLPTGNDPNFSEIVKLRTEFPWDPLFCPNLNIRIMDQKWDGEEVLGATSVPLVDMLPMWEPVAATKIVRMWRGKLARRSFLDMKNTVRAQAMLRGWRVRHEYRKALMEARKIHHVVEVEDHETTGLLGKTGEFAAGGISNLAKGFSAVSTELVDMSGGGDNAETAPPVKAKKMYTVPKKAGEEDTEVLFWQYNPDGECFYTKDGDVDEYSLPRVREADRSRASGKWLLPQKLKGGKVQHLRKECRAPLEDAKKDEQLMFPARFKSYELHRGTDVGDDDTGFFTKLSGGDDKPSKEMSGFVKVLSRIIDETPPTVQSSSGNQPTLYITDDIVYMATQPEDMAAKEGDRLMMTVGRATKGVRSSAVGADPSSGTRPLDAPSIDRIDQNYQGVANALPNVTQRSKRDPVAPTVFDLSNKIPDMWLYGYNDAVLVQLSKSEAGIVWMDHILKDLVKEYGQAYNSGAHLKEYVEEENNPPGKLILNFFTATDMKNPNFFGGFDPYVQISVGSYSQGAKPVKWPPQHPKKVARTKIVTVKKGATADFTGEEMEVFLDESDATPHGRFLMKFELLDKGSGKEPVVIGKKTLDLKDLGVFKGDDVGAPPIRPIEVFGSDLNSGANGKVDAQFKFVHGYEEDEDGENVGELGPEDAHNAMRATVSEVSKRWNTLKSLFNRGSDHMGPTAAMTTFDPNPIESWIEEAGKCAVIGRLTRPQATLKTIQEKLTTAAEPNTAWIAAKPKGSAERPPKSPWIQWEYSAGSNIILDTYSLTYATGLEYDDPRLWVLVGSCGASQWDTLSLFGDEEQKNSAHAEKIKLLVDTKKQTREMLAAGQTPPEDDGETVTVNNCIKGIEFYSLARRDKLPTKVPTLDTNGRKNKKNGKDRIGSHFKPESYFRDLSYEARQKMLAELDQQEEDAELKNAKGSKGDEEDEQALEEGDADEVVDPDDGEDPLEKEIKRLYESQECMLLCDLQHLLIESPLTSIHYQKQGEVMQTVHSVVGGHDHNNEPEPEVSAGGGGLNSCGMYSPDTFHEAITRWNLTQAKGLTKKKKDHHGVEFHWVGKSDDCDQPSQNHRAGEEDGSSSSGEEEDHHAKIMRTKSARTQKVLKQAATLHKTKSANSQGTLDAGGRMTLNVTDVDAILKEIEDIMRNTAYRWYQLVLTDTYGSGSGHVQIGAVTLQAKEKPWGDKASQKEKEIEEKAEAPPPAAAGGGVTEAAPQKEDGLQKLLVPKPVVVRAYVIEAKDLMSKDSDGKSNPYIEARLGNETKGSEDDQRHSLNPQLRMMHEFETSLPGASKLELTLWDDDFVGRQEMGSTVIDLEDRWFSSAWRDKSMAIGQKPVEWRTLLLKTSRASQGSLRIWVDIMEVDDRFTNPAVDISRPPGIPYELRLVIYSGTKLPCQDEFSAQNDAYCSVQLIGECDDNDGSPFESTQVTDTHWRCQAEDPGGCRICLPRFGSCKHCCAQSTFCCFCRCFCKRKCCPGSIRKATCFRVNAETATTGASWNWRLKFDVELPMRDIRMALTCRDKDMLNIGGEDDMIGIFQDSDFDSADPSAGFDSLNRMFRQAEREFKRHAIADAHLKEKKEDGATPAVIEDLEAELAEMPRGILHRPMPDEEWELVNPQGPNKGAAVAKMENPLHEHDHEDGDRTTSTSHTPHPLPASPLPAPPRARTAATPGPPPHAMPVAPAKVAAAVAGEETEAQRKEKEIRKALTAKKSPASQNNLAARPMGAVGIVLSGAGTYFGPLPVHVVLHLNPPVLVCSSTSASKRSVSLRNQLV
jgi:hypothetical protein